MTTSNTVILHGTTIEDPVPEMDAKCVCVVLEPLDDERFLSAQEQREAWQE